MVIQRMLRRFGALAIVAGLLFGMAAPAAAVYGVPVPRPGGEQIDRGAPGLDAAPSPEPRPEAVLGQVAERPRVAAAADRTLPVTGADVAGLLALGALLVVAGVAVVRLGRPRATAT